MGGKWVYSIKEGSDGHDQYKARFVAKGYSQKAVIDYSETASPTSNLTSVRIVMQKAAQDKLILHQMDVKTAYLHAPIDRDICMEQPEGYEKGGKQLVCKLCKHVDIKYHFIRSTIREEKMTLAYCPTDDMVADAMNKPVSKLNLMRFAGVMFGG